MSFQDFLDQQEAQGIYDSEGAFTLDFKDAAERLATFRLPSESHYLLKVVQIASRLGAETIKIKLENFRTSIHFRAPRADGVNHPESITRAFLAPLEVKDPVLADLASALWGAIGASTQEILWSFSERYKGRRIFIKDGVFRFEDFPIETPLAEGELPCAFTLSVLHKKTWRFWLNSRRNANAYMLLLGQCGFSRVTLFVDGREVERKPSSYFTEHRPRELRYELGTEQGRWAYPVALYQLTREGGFESARPNLSQYVVRERHVNIWASATRITNSLIPDGLSSPAWLLNFLDHEGHGLSMRAVSKRARCRLMIAYDPAPPGGRSDLRLTLVRQSIILSEPKLDGISGLEAWKGCHLILDDDTLGTDLTGFQVIEDDRLTELLASLTPHLETAKAFLAEHKHMAVGLK